MLISKRQVYVYWYGIMYIETEVINVNIWLLYTIFDQLLTLYTYSSHVLKK